MERVLTSPPPLPPHKYSAFSYAHVIKMEFNELHGRCVIVVAKRGGGGEEEKEGGVEGVVVRVETEARVWDCSRSSHSALVSSSTLLQFVLR